LENFLKTSHLHHGIAQKALRLWCVCSICCGALHHVEKKTKIYTEAAAVLLGILHGFSQSPEQKFNKLNIVFNVHIQLRYVQINTQKKKESLCALVGVY
jgi:hypothetical protein